MRLGELDPAIFPNESAELERPVWFHAVSVGELNALLPIFYNFQGMRIVLSVTTHTAYNLAQSKLQEEIETNKIRLFYMPWDHPSLVKKVITRIQPRAIVLMESEIWPGLINEAHSKKIKLIIINAKLSDSSFENYRNLYFIFRPIFSKFDLLMAQSPNDSRKFLRLGIDKSKILMTGNMKFSVLPSQKRNREEFREDLGYTNKDLLWVCGSTHEEEEAVLISIFQEIQAEFPELRLILAPRHPERFSIVEDMINSAAKLIPVRLSSNQKIEGQHDILLVDTIGDLYDIYSISDLAFVGGTLNTKIGGHNVLEPASCKIPVLVGPSYYKNTPIVDMLEEAGGLIVAETKEDIRILLKDLLSNPDKRILMGVNAKKLVEENKKIIFTVAQKLKEVIYDK
jgi:3-deoxy-D-manno-octulosonic-acid transferase